MRIDNTGRECLYVTRDHDVEAEGAHPSKSAKGEAAGFGVVQRWASPPATTCGLGRGRAWGY